MNNRIRIARGNTDNISTNETIAADGQPFYDTDRKYLYIGNGNKKLSSYMSDDCITTNRIVTKNYLVSEGEDGERFTTSLILNSVYDKTDGVYGVYRFDGVSKGGGLVNAVRYVEIDKNTVDFYNSNAVSNWKMSRIESNGDVYVGNNLNVDKNIELYGNLKVSPMVVATEERGNIEAKGTITAEGGFIGNLTGVASKADNVIKNLENNSYSPLKWDSNNSVINEGISSSLYTEIDTHKVHLDAWVNLWKAEDSVGVPVAAQGYTTIDLPEIANIGEIYQFEVVFAYDNDPGGLMDSLIKLPLEGEHYFNTTVIRQRFAFGPGNDVTNTYVALPLSTLTSWQDGDKQGGSSALLVSRNVGLTQLYFQYVEKLNASNPGNNGTVLLYAINLLV